MSKINVADYLTDAKGEKSSSRLFAWKSLKFFFWFNGSAIIMMFAIILLTFFKSYEGASNMDISFVWNVFKFILAFDLLMLVSIYTPKQLNKITETKGFVELAKNECEENTPK